MEYQDYYKRLVKLSEVIFQLFNNRDEIGDANFYTLLGRVYKVYKEEHLDNFPYMEAMEYYSAEMAKFYDNGLFLHNWIGRHRELFYTHFFAFVVDEFKDEMDNPISKEIGSTIQWLFVEFCNVCKMHGRSEDITDFPNVIGFPTMAEELHIDTNKGENVLQAALKPGSRFMRFCKQERVEGYKLDNSKKIRLLYDIIDGTPDGWKDNMVWQAVQEAGIEIKSTPFYSAFCSEKDNEVRKRIKQAYDNFN